MTYVLHFAACLMAAVCGFNLLFVVFDGTHFRSTLWIMLTIFVAADAIVTQLRKNARGDGPLVIDPKPRRSMS